jgi:RNA polymerase sigma factor (sigma-70 family)
VRDARRSDRRPPPRFLLRGGANFSSRASTGVVAIANTQRSGRDVTRALVENIAGGERGARLRSHLAAGRSGATRDQIEEAMQEACLLAERACRGQTESEVFAWLRTTAQRELWRIQKRARRELPVDIDSLPVHPEAWTVAGPEQELIDREDLTEVDEAAHAVLARFSERQRQIAALHTRGHTRPQIAAHLGMTPRTVKRQLERIMTVGRGELVRLAGHGCDAGEPVVARLAFGLASPREIQDAQLHLALCRQCGALFERLDLWREKVAALLPLPVIEQAHPGALERALHHVADGFASLRQRSSDGTEALRQQAGDSSAQVKQHASAVYYRAVDPTPLAGIRPGAAAAAIAGCLAIGGGTTYCVTQNVDPFGGLRAITGPAPSSQHAETHPTRHVRRRPSATPTPTATATAALSPVATATATSSTPADAARKQPTATATPTPSPAPEQEYEPLGTAGNTTQHASSTPTKPARAPAGGPGEFGGP